MEGWFFLAILLFIVAGVIYLLGKTKQQEKSIRELRRRVDELLAVERETSPRAATGPVTSGENSILDETITLDESATPDTTSPETAGTALPERQNRLKNTILAFVRRGNLWAAGGIVLIIVGFGTLIAYLGRQGFFTVEMGITAAAVVGLLMCLGGWRFRRKRPAFFLILQGGGIGTLYLSIFAAHTLTAYLGVVLSMVLMSILVPPAVIMALAQNSQGLAVLGFFGGFAAPLLLSNGGGNHLFLFIYFAVLNAGVFALGFYRSWKGLNLLAFLFTFVTSLYWTMNRYVPEFFSSSEPFFLLYFLFFTVLGLRALQNRNYRFPRPQGSTHYSDVIIILGTPVASAVLQWKLFSFFEHGYAVIALVFSAFYLALSAAILKKGNRVMRGYAEVFLVLGAFLANLAIPLELSAGISGVLWAAEAVVVFFLGIRTAGRTWKGEFLPQEPGEAPARGDPRIMSAGIILHLVATIAFIRSITVQKFTDEAAPWRSPAFTGSLIIAVSALALALIAEKLAPKTERKKQNILCLCAALWGFAWWFGGWYFEFRRVFSAAAELFLILASLSALLSWLVVVFFELKFFIIGMVAAPLAALFMVIGVFGGRIIDCFLYEPESIFTWNFFAYRGFPAWLVFFVCQILMIILFRARSCRSEPLWFRDTRIFIVILTALAVLSASGRFYTTELGLSISWTSLAGLFPLFAALIIIPFCGGGKNRQGRKLLFPILPGILSGILGLWFIVTLFLPGDPSPLPVYVPVLNPLDLLEGLCIASILFWQIKVTRKTGKPTLGRRGIIVFGDILVFFWIISILARSVYYYSGISWRRVFGSDVFQLCLFVFWALYGILHIIFGNRMKTRIPWIAGAILVTVDIAKLILLDMREISAVRRILSFFVAGLVLLFIGWAAPLPPPHPPELRNDTNTTGDAGQ